MRPPAARRRPLTPRDLPGATRQPYTGFVAPCLPSPGGRVPARGRWVHEIKHDGYRAQGHFVNGKGRVYTRNGFDWTHRFERIADHLSKLPAREFILDGEIVVMDTRNVSDFHLLQDDLARNRTDRMVYLVFDLLYLNGVDIRAAPLIERKRLLGQLLRDQAQDGATIQFNPHIEAEASALFEKVCAMHLEGIVSKDATSPYRSGRQSSWIKTKCVNTETFPIVAFVPKLGASPRRIASLYLGRWEGNRLLYAGKAQTGFQKSMLYELRERLDPYIRDTSPLSVPVKKPKAIWVEPAVLAEIEFTALTAEKRLRAPVFRGIRDDLVAPRIGPKRNQTRRGARRAR